MAVYLFVQYESTDGGNADLEEISPPCSLGEVKEHFKKMRLKEISECVEKDKYQEMLEELEQEEREYQRVVFLEVVGIKELDYAALKAEMLDELHEKAEQQNRTKKEEQEKKEYERLKAKFEKGT